MKKLASIRKLIGIISVCCLFFSTLLINANAVTTKQKQRGQEHQVQSSSQTTPNSNAFALTSSQLGFNGPLSFGINRDNLFHYGASLQYAYVLSDNAAIAAIGEYASDAYRLNATFGFNAFSDGLVKFSAERLSQILPFNFDAKNINQRLAQNAYGARYQHVLNNSFIRNIDFGGYYARTSGKALSYATNFAPGINLIHNLHMAGGISKGLDLGTDLVLTQSTLLNGHVYYDKISYDSIYATSTATGSKGIGGSLGLAQVLNDHFKIDIDASARKIYNTFAAGVHWLPTGFSGFGLEVSLLGEKVVAHNGTPNENKYGLQFSFNPGKIGKYKAGIMQRSTDIGAWVNKPAVYMQQVLAVKDQAITTQDQLDITINGQPVGSNTSTISLTNVIPGQQYILELGVVGGTGTTYQYTSTDLPAFLSLDPDTGKITGTDGGNIPANAAPGSYPFTVTVTTTTALLHSQASDKSYASDATTTKSEKRRQQFEAQIPGNSIIVQPIQITTTATAFPEGVVDSLYNDGSNISLSATGGKGTYTWSIISGTAPAWFNLNSGNGNIVNSNTMVTGEAGTYTFTVQATDGTNTSTKQFSLTVKSTPLTINATKGEETTTDGTLPILIADNTYTDYIITLSANNGIEPYAWASPDMPNWLTLTEFGQIVVNSLPPVTTSHVSFNITVTDSSTPPRTGTQQFSLTVAQVSVQQIQITTTFPDGVVGSTYNDGASISLSATNGSGEYTWSISSNGDGEAIPPWFVHATIEDGVIGVNTDVPVSPSSAADGSYTFTIQVTDGTSTVTTQFKLLVQQQQGIVFQPLNETDTFIVPANLVDYDAYEYDGLKLLVTGGTTPYNWDMTITNPDVPPSDNTPWILTESGNLRWYPTATKLSYNMIIKVTDAMGLSASRSFTMTVEQPTTPTILVMNDPKATVSTTANSDGSYDATLPARPFGIDYTEHLSTSGGTGELTWSANLRDPNNNDIPTVTISEGNLFIPKAELTTAGNYTGTITVTDSSEPIPQTVTWKITITMNLVIILDHNELNKMTGEGTYTLPNMVKNIPGIGHQFNAVGGSGQYTWSIDGELPSGIRWYIEVLGFPQAGVSDGTPYASGEFNFTIKVEDSLNPLLRSTQNFKLTVNDSNMIVTKITPVTTTPLINYPFKVTLFNVTGGIAPYTWSINSGTFPPDLHLNPTTGEIIGTPTQAGNYSFAMKVMDAQHSVFITPNVTLTISELIISPIQMTVNPQINEFWTGKLHVTGGSGNYIWSIAEGSTLPPGLNLDPNTGEISGTPTTANENGYSFVIQATNDQASATIDIQLPVVEQNKIIIITPQLFDEISPDTQYTKTLNATGGSGNYIWSIAAGSTLPLGLNLNPNTGEISGTPTAIGAWPFWVTATDEQNPTLSNTSPFVVCVGDGRITTETLPNATPNTPYSTILQVSGGSNYIWELKGNLPVGLNLNPDTGTISGTPWFQSKGEYPFTIYVSNKLTTDYITHKALVLKLI